MSLGFDLLSKVIEENRLQAFGKLDPSWFIQGEDAIYTYIKDFVISYGCLPSIEIFDSKFKLPKSKEPYQYTYDELLKRTLMNEFGKILSPVNECLTKQDPLGALKLLKESVIKFDTNIVSGQDLYTLEDLGKMVETYIEEVKGMEGLTGVPTGWPTLDEQCAGWQKGDLDLIVARPKAGKSLIMGYTANMAYNMGYVPMLISMEMKALQYARRLIAMRANLSMDSIKKGAISEWGKEKLREEIVNIGAKQPFYFVEGQFKKNISDIASLIHGLKPDIVFIDGGYLVKVLNSSKAKWEKTTEIAEELKSLATVANIPIIVSFQFNREATKDKKGKGEGNVKVGLEHIQLSDALGQLASLVIGIFNDESSKQRKRLEILAGREGESGEFFINWLWDHRMDFTEVPDSSVLIQELYGKETL